MHYYALTEYTANRVIYLSVYNERRRDSWAKFMGISEFFWVLWLSLIEAAAVVLKYDTSML